MGITLCLITARSLNDSFTSAGVISLVFPLAVFSDTLAILLNLEKQSFGYTPVLPVKEYRLLIGSHPRIRDRPVILSLKRR